MERWQLQHEKNNLLESLIEKTNFVYSEKFYSLSELDRQKFLEEKIAEEAHLNSLCNLLWNKEPTKIGLQNIMFMSMLGSSFANNSITCRDEDKHDTRL